MQFCFPDNPRKQKLSVVGTSLRVCVRITLRVRAYVCVSLDLCLYVCMCVCVCMYVCVHHCMTAGVESSVCVNLRLPRQWHTCAPTVVHMCTWVGKCSKHQQCVSAVSKGMGWLWLDPTSEQVGSIKVWVSFAKEPYKRDNILQKRHII